MIREVLTLSQLRDMPSDEAASLWTVRQAEGELPHEKELFQQWLELTPANRAAWERAQDGWHVFDRADGDEVLEAMRVHARNAGPVTSERWRRFASAAAALLVIATGSIVADRAGIFDGSGSEVARSSGPPAVAAAVEYANGRELPRVVTLSDGSRMTLDAETRVSALLSPRERRLQVLSGRAFFAVQHDAARPFIVRVRNVEVTAIGTRFDVRMGERDVRVLLVEGRLSVKAGLASAQPILMSAGQQMIARDRETPSILQATNGDAPDWQQGYARFEDETLAQAAAVLNRYPGDRLVVRDPRIAGLRISGNFKIGNPERFGRTLEEIYPVRVVRRSGDELEIVAG